MLFDVFSRLVERNKELFDLLPIMKQVKLFQFQPEKAKEYLIIVREYSDEQIRDVEENFVLPFNVVGVEHDGSLVLLINKDDEKEKGFFREFYFIVVIDLGKTTDKYKDLFSEIPQDLLYGFSGSITREGVKPGSTILTYPICEITGADTDVKLVPISDKNKELSPLSRAMFRELVQDVGSVMNLFTILQDSKLWVLENSPQKMRKQGKKTKVKIRRVCDRPTYTILKPREIRDKMGLEKKGERRVVTPHERRRHLRRLESERFTNKKGSTIIIPATWVGPSEKAVGNKNYKVVLDV